MGFSTDSGVPRRAVKDRSSPKSSKKLENSKKQKPEKDDDSEDLSAAVLEDLSRSGLDKADYKKLRLEPLDRDETDDFVGQPRLSYRIPYFDLRGKTISYSRVRFLENKKGKFTKGHGGSFRYSQPFNSSPHVYFPPYFNWKKIAKDPSLKILITEGEKKAAMACKLGIACIALGGVYGFKSSKRLWDLIPELQEIEWKDREVEICYDADVMMKSEVRQALSALAFTLSQEYSPSEINFVFLDAETAGPKTGLDDYLKEHGTEGFEELPRQPYRANARIQELNQKICFVRKVARYYDIEMQMFYKNEYHMREAYKNNGKEIVDGKRTAYAIDLWTESANRRTVMNVVYKPGDPEMTDQNELNTWRPSHVAPKKGSVKRWLDLVEFIFRKPEYAEWFLKWLAYPIQHTGTKLLQAVFVYGKQQGVGKTFVVDPLMEYVHGADNFYRLQNDSLNSKFNSYAAGKLFVVTNEIYLPEYRDRRSAMSSLKDMITRETVSVNEKFQPEIVYRDHCNYYFTSNHSDALILDKGDRRFLVIEAPQEKLPQSDYDELDEWMREGDGANMILHHLQNKVNLDDFNPKADAMTTTWRQQIIAESKDPLTEFADSMRSSPQYLFMMNGMLPDLELCRAEDAVTLFDRTYPKNKYPMTVNRMARALTDPDIEKRKVRMSGGDDQITLYAVFNRNEWADRTNKQWAEHYRTHAKIFGGRSRH